jgi:hypothetical protein
VHSSRTSTQFGSNAARDAAAGGLVPPRRVIRIHVRVLDEAALVDVPVSSWRRLVRGPRSKPVSSCSFKPAPEHRIRIARGFLPHDLPKGPDRDALRPGSPQPRAAPPLQSDEPSTSAHPLTSARSNIADGDEARAGSGDRIARAGADADAVDLIPRFSVPARLPHALRTPWGQVLISRIWGQVLK